MRPKGYTSLSETCHQSETYVAHMQPLCLEPQMPLSTDLKDVAVRTWKMKIARTCARAMRTRYKHTHKTQKILWNC